MGKFRTRANKSKGKRWIKGHSCVSNPAISKHREIAKGRFFQENLNTDRRDPHSALTCDALHKHDILLNNSEMEESEQDMQSEGGDTFHSFASDYTHCANKSFNKLMVGFRSNSAHHKEMLAVLAAITEVIKSQGGSETTNEYFGALLTVLDVNGTEDHVSAVVSLLKMTVRSVSQGILIRNVEDLIKIFSDVLEKFASSENSGILSGTLDCFGTILKAQESSGWHRSSMKDAFKVILAFSTHSKPKVRKSAQAAIRGILKDKKFPTSDLHPAADVVGSFCADLLVNPTGNVASSGITTVLHTLGLLKSILGAIPKSELKRCCENILKVMTLGDPRVNLCALQALQGLFMLGQMSSLSPNLNAQLIGALFDFKPDDSDVDLMMVWLTVMQEAYCCLNAKNKELCLSNINRFVKQVGQLFEKERTELLSGAANALHTVIYECLHVKEDTDEATHLPLIEHIGGLVMKILDSNFRSHCYSAWKYVIYVLGAVYESIGKYFPALVAPSLKHLGMLREQEQLDLGAHIDKAVGSAVQSMGPAAVLQCLPLDITFDGQQMQFPNSWILPVLRDSVEKTNLAYFTETIAPLAAQCKQKWEDLSKQNMTAAAHSFRLVYIQLWSLLPCFCTHPTDFDTAIKEDLAKLMGKVGLKETDICIDVMSGLRKLLGSAEGKENSAGRGRLSHYSKNFLPILFNMWNATDNLVPEGHRLAALETIKMYMPLSPPEWQQKFFDHGYQELTQAVEKAKSVEKKKKPKNAKNDVDAKFRDSLLQLLMTMLPYQDISRVKILCQMCSSLLHSQDHKEQKRGYRILEELCKSESEACKSYVQSNLSAIIENFGKAMESTKPPSRASRLRCLLLLMGRLEPKHRPLLHTVIPETVLCCKDINEKCRTAAYAVLVQIGQTLQRWSDAPAQEVVREYLAILLPGLQGSISLMSATMLALSSLLNEYGDLIAKDTLELLIHNMTSLITCNTREIVQACLSFFKALLSTYDAATLGPHLEILMHGLTEMNEDCKRHFRVKCRELLVRLVRRYSIEVISSFVPKEDEFMLKRLKNIRKELDRKARTKADKKEDSEDEMDIDFGVKTKTRSIAEILGESDDENEELEDNENEKPSQKSKAKVAKAWIREKEESFLDFTDPSAAQKISATNPVTKNQVMASTSKDKNRGFKTAPDGRLIIKDDSDGEEEKAPKKRRRNATTSDSENDSDANEDDDIDEAATPGRYVLAPGNKRRKAMSVSSRVSFDPDMRYKAGGSGIHRPINSGMQQGNKKMKMGQKPRDLPGTEYQATKARGDVKKKGKPDPYAYVPLDSKLLNRRKRAKHAGTIKRLVVSAKKGADRGSKSRSRKVMKRRK